MIGAAAGAGLPGAGAAATLATAVSAGTAGRGNEPVAGDCGMGSGALALVEAFAAAGGLSLGGATGSGGLGERASAEFDRGAVGTAGITVAGPVRGVAASAEDRALVVAGSGIGDSIFGGEIDADTAMSPGGDRVGRSAINDAPMNIPARKTIVIKKNRTAVRPSRPSGARLVEGG